MKRTVYLLLIMGLISILVPNAFARDILTTISIKPVMPMQTLEEPIAPPPPVDAINLLHDEGYLTKEERNILLYSYAGWFICDKWLVRIWNIVKKVAGKIAKDKRVKKTVKMAWDTVLLRTSICFLYRHSICFLAIWFIPKRSP